ncbi:MAG: divergent polysaccharide deacetylase family protein [Thermodesulfobacteriota bacterium]|nr:divergent polysaccharide deacetylase family protein [Thermodesulfobacteriota bacterium]
MSTKTTKKTTQKRTSAKNKATKKTTQKKTESLHRFRATIAIVFLCIVATAGLFVVINWPTPTSSVQPSIEQIKLPTHPTALTCPTKQNLPPQHQETTPPLTTDNYATIAPANNIATIAIIMDDVGINLALGTAAINLDIPLTVAIIPGERYSTKLMNLAHNRQREILIHMPMEPSSYPQNDPGHLGLFVDHSDEQIIAKTQQLIELLPYAAGGNNHMGSEFTRHGDKMDLVLREMKKKDLFFIDSLTIAKSVAYQQAQHLGIPSAMRDLFLDNDRDVVKILYQLQKLVNIAQKSGQAIGICHPYPETIEALSQFSLAINSTNIGEPTFTIVPVSRMVH